MRRGWTSVSIAVVAAAALAPVGASASAARTKAAPQAAARVADLPANVRQVCPQSLSVLTMSCLALVRTDVPGHLGLMSTAPAGYGPAQLQSAYNLTSASSHRGLGETVELIDAFNDPLASADLAIYRQQFGLAPCDKATGAGCLTKISWSSLAPLPRADAAWAEQESMDIDMVTAICPNCHILLQETASVDETSMEGIGGAKFVSLGFAEPENPGFYDNRGMFDQSDGIAVVAAAGDSGYGAEYPASSQFVTAVGGTSLVRDPGSPRGWAETAWSATGSGCSAEQFQPTWQYGVATGCALRAANDVAAVADPETGVAFYDSYRSDGWGVGGGTNISSAIIAAVYALAGTPTPNTFPASYPYRHPGALNDITSGANGTCSPSEVCTAGARYDGPTGLGSPNGIAAFRLGTTKDVITLSPIEGRGLSLTVGHAIFPYYLQELDSDASQRLRLSFSGLPPGLSGNFTVIKGTPTKPGSFLLRLKAVDGTGASATLTLPLKVYADAITISAPVQEWTPVGTTIAPVAVQGSDSAPSQALTFTAAHLPPGLSLTQTGPTTATISGTANVAGRYSGLITATDSTGASQITFIDWGVFGTITLPSQADVTSTAGDPVLMNFSAADSEAGARVGVGLTGPTPLGTGMNDSGQLSGWPIRPGVYHVAAVASDNYGASASAPFTWTVEPAPDAGPTGAVRLSLAKMCLTDKNDAPANGTAVVISRCAGLDAQRWTVVQDGTLRIHGKCLDTVHHSLQSGAKAELWACTSDLSQRWRMAGTGHFWQLYAAGCLVDPGSSTIAGTQLVAETCGTGSSERWTLPSGPIASQVPGMCVTDPGNASVPGTVVVTSSCDGTSGQDWSIRPDGTIRIHDRCLDYARYGTARKPSIHLADCTGTPSQQWSNLTNTSDLELEPALENQAAFACLDDPRASTTDGTPLAVGPCPQGPLADPGISWRVS